MALTWDSWASVSDGKSTPGAPVTVVPWGDTYAAFIADPNGAVYGIKAEAGFGWDIVPGRYTVPGAHITAVASGNRFILFMADTSGEIFKTSGSPYQGWDTWTNVSEGGSTPGAPVTVVPWGDTYALFIANPNGEIYGIKAEPGFGWELVPGRKTLPGAHITAIASGDSFILFMADVTGEIFKTSGAPYQGWDTWGSVSEGSSTPGAPVTVVPWGDTYAAFIADPNGAVYGIKAEPGFGWEIVPGQYTVPGAQVTGVSWYKPPQSETERFLLFMTGTDGAIYTTSGIPYQGWDTWASVPEGSSTPGAPVTAVTRKPQGFALFDADNAGVIRRTSSSAPPATPANLHVTSATAQTISVSWTESNPASVELDGFLSYLTRMTSGGEETGLTIHGPGDRAASYTGLTGGGEYEIRIGAFNANGYSAEATLNATTPVAEETVFVNLTPQDVSNPDGAEYVPYEGKYPAFGSVPAGHVIQITLPNPSSVPRLGFVKPGNSNSTEMCGDPNAVVIILAGQTTSPAQMTEIFGVARPPFSTTAPLDFLACVDGGSLPNFIQLDLTIVPDG